MSLTRAKARNKLKNALTAFNGYPPFYQPQPHAIERVKRWLKRCRERGLKVSVMIDGKLAKL